MSDETLKSIGKLRTVARNMAKGMNLEHHEDCNLLLIIADEIEREIAERYMELPVDADGVPWHIGDMTENRNVVNGIAFDRHGAHFVSTLNDIDPSIHTHFKQRTVEDVLRDLIDGIGSVEFDAMTEIEKAVKDIIEIMGGDGDD